MIRVPITTSELAICTYVGKYRNHISSQYVKDRRQDKSQDGIDILVNGVLTEYAVSKFLNIHFDLNCEFRKFGTDLISAKGATIDVKCTTKIGGNLNAVVWSAQKPCDVFVLTEIRHSHVLIVGCHVLIVGWIDRESFLRNENKRDVGNGDFYSVQQSKLTPFKELNDQKTL